MTLIQPAALGALIAIPLILLLYVLRPRHRRLVVSSVRLWRHLPSDLEGRPRWRLPVSNLLLLIQLLAAGALAFALARPGLPGEIRQHLILLVDCSPSMLATDVEPSRFAAAVQQARSRVAQLHPEDEATLIAVDPSPRIVASGKGAQAIDQALDRLAPAAGRGDLTTALLLASQVAELSRDSHNQVIILSDGAGGGASLDEVGAIPADLSFQQIGTSDTNQAVTALSVRPMIGSDDRFVGFVQVTNYAHLDAKIPFEARADGLSVGRQTLTIPARGHVELSLPLPVGTHLLSVALQTKDALRQDDQAVIIVPSNRDIAVTLVATDPSFWTRALKPVPNVRLKVVNPSTYHPDGAMVTIFQGFVPSTLPPGNLVLVAPPPGNVIVPVDGEVQNATLVHADDGNALVNSVDLIGLFVPQLLHFGSLAWAQTIVDSSQGPAILAGEQNGRQIVIIGFDPRATDWPQRISFPVFAANLIDTLTPQRIASQVKAGSVLDIAPTADAKQLLVKLPDGKIDVFGGGRMVRFTDTDQLGTYQVTETDGSAAIAQHDFVVERLGIAESNIVPQVDPSQLARSGSPNGRPSLHEVWIWLAGGVLALMSLEWLVFFRRLSG